MSSDNFAAYKKGDEIVNTKRTKVRVTRSRKTRDPILQ
jgi:hypothetical protein